MDQAVNEFWAATRAILDETPVNATLTENPDLSGREYETWDVALSSYGGQRLRAHYTAPRHGSASGRFPAVLAVPGYGGGKDIPYHVVMHGFAVLTLFPRAQGESIPEWDLPDGTTKLTYNVTDKEAYYYRAGYMDCVRGVDFLAEREDVDSSRIGMWSRSQGGGFTLATAALDQRLAAAVAEEPFMCNYPVAIDIDTRPYHELRNYVQEHPEQRQAMLDTLRYFDRPCPKTRRFCGLFGQNPDFSGRCQSFRAKNDFTGRAAKLNETCMSARTLLIHRTTIRCRVD